MGELEEFATKNHPQLMSGWQNDIGRMPLLKADEIFNTIFEPFLLTLGKPKENRRIGELLVGTVYNNILAKN